MYWASTRFWEGRDVYILGGGPSLVKFDWSSLIDRAVIGCNSAFFLGADICNICVFGDLKWWETFKWDLQSYKGLVVTNVRQLRDSDCSWLFTMLRKPKGLGHKSLGWNSNTGASAINLALILGAKRVYLLGFDMKLGASSKVNWHDKQIQKCFPEVYDRFKIGFENVACELNEKFPGCEIINLTEDSNLNAFPKQSIIEHFSVEVVNGK